MRDNNTGTMICLGPRLSLREGLTEMKYDLALRFIPRLQRRRCGVDRGGSFFLSVVAG